MKLIQIIQSLIFFILAGLCEIGGGYLVWLWLREDKSAWLGVLGGAVLVLYGIIPTLQPLISAGYTRHTGEFLSCSPSSGVGKLTK